MHFSLAAMRHGEPPRIPKTPPDAGFQPRMNIRTLRALAGLANGGIIAVRPTEADGETLSRRSRVGEFPPGR
jgi:hypothetical protein